MKTRLFVLSLAAACLAYGAAAQTFPTRPLRVVVPWPVAGGPDIGTRAMIPAFEKQLGQTVIVENRPGANSITGTRSVAAAAPDGYTLLSGNTAFSLNPAAKLQLPYDSLNDFVPVGEIGRGTGYIVFVAPSSGITSVPELITSCKKRDCFYGSAGIGNATHLAAAVFSAKTNTPMKHIPYPGVADSMHALLRGEVTVAFVTPAAGTGKALNGELRAIAFTGDTPLKELPEVPLLKEYVQGFRLSGAWLGLFAPAGTPKSVVETINAALRRAGKNTDVEEQLSRLGYIPSDRSPEEFADFVRNDIADWAAAFKVAGVEAQ